MSFRTCAKNDILLLLCRIHYNINKRIQNKSIAYVFRHSFQKMRIEFHLFVFEFQIILEDLMHMAIQIQMLYFKLGEI